MLAFRGDFAIPGIWKCSSPAPDPTRGSSLETIHL